MEEKTPLSASPAEISYGGSSCSFTTPDSSLHFDSRNDGEDTKRRDNADGDDGEEHVDPRHRWDQQTRHRRGLSVELIVEDVLESMAEVKEAIGDAINEVQEVMQEEVAEPVKPREEGDHSQKLSAIALAVLVFYKVSGGAFGCEPAVKAGGPLGAILGFLIFPIIWSVPEALVTAELGSAYPEPSGSVAWVEEAFGPRAVLLSGYFHWVSGATDNAIYPSLFLEYVASFFADVHNIDLGGNLVRFVFTAIMSLALAAINYTGLEIVGNVSMAVCVISLSPFVLMVILGIPKLDPGRWLIMPEEDSGLTMDDDTLGSGWFPESMWLGIMWRPLINSLFWNLNSFDVGASFAGEVQDPARIFPRAMFISVALVALSYILPLLVALGATDSQQEDWKAGYFTTAATDIAGPWLGVWLVFGSAVSNIALFEAEMSGDAYQLMGMADRGLIPKLFSKRSKFETPTNGIILGTMVIIAMSVANFDQLVEMLNFAYSISLLMEFGAFIKLRITDADVERPYRVPFGTFGCVLFVIPPSCVCIYLMLVASKMTYAYFAALVLCGFLFAWMQKFAKHYNWLSYTQAPPKRNKRKNTLAPLSEL